MVRAALIGLLLASAPATAQDRDIPMNVGTGFLIKCESPTSRDFLHCAGYVQGLLEGLRGRDMIADDQRICIGENVNLQQVWDVIIQFLRDVPERRNMSMNLLTLVALSRAFPCPPR